MSRKRKDGTEEVEADEVEEEQAEMFPELGASDEEKEVLRISKRFGRENARRKALLSTSKEKVDGIRDKLIAKMHELKLKKFKHDGVRVELIETSERVEVELDDTVAKAGDD